MTFLLVLTHLSFSAALSKMASSSVESRQISYLTRVKKIPEKDVLDVQEVGLLLQMYDLVMEVVSIEYMNKNCC